MNPRIKKIGRNILFLLSIPGIITAFVFANSNYDEEKLKAIHIEITNPALSFVTQQDILDLLASKHVVVDESILRNIPAEQLENMINHNKWVKHSDIYFTADHVINVKVQQRTPVVRINHTDSVDFAYYLDEFADPIELSNQYIAKVPVVTSPRLSYQKTDLRLKRQLVELASFLQRDSFWNTMISQIHINEQREIELIPALGNHLILLGNTDYLDHKMNRLLTFYKEGLHTVDWERYDQIDLRFKHQIVARNTQVTELIDKTLEKEKALNQLKALEKSEKAIASKPRTMATGATSKQTVSHLPKTTKVKKVEAKAPITLKNSSQSN